MTEINNAIHEISHGTLQRNKELVEQCAELHAMLEMQRHDMKAVREDAKALVDATRKLTSTKPT